MTNPLSPEVKEWVRCAVSPEARVLGSVELKGSSSATLYRITLLHGLLPVRVVLRLFTNHEWLAVEPDIPEHEAAALEKVSAAGLPVPHLLACDPRGEFCTVPAILMSEVPGKVDLLPASIEGWLRQMAEFLLRLHELPPAGFPWQYRPYYKVDELVVPAWSARPKLWQQAIEIVRSPAPSAPQCYIHRDFHPVNILWKRGKLTGVVDWVNSCTGPAGIDVAWCRHNLAGMYGLPMADRFLAICQEVMGSSWTYDPYWDLLTVLELLPGPINVYAPWSDFGLNHLNAEVLTRRDEDYLASLLKRME